MITIHAYTNNQRILDLIDKDLRRIWAAAMILCRPAPGYRHGRARGDFYAHL